MKLKQRQTNFKQFQVLVASNPEQIQIRSNNYNWNSRNFNTSWKNFKQYQIDFNHFQIRFKQI